MDRQSFSDAIERLIPQNNVQATNNWIAFVEDIVDSGQYVNFKESPRPDAIGAWFSQCIAALYFIRKEYGSKIVQQIWELSLEQASLYPNEMKAAADIFKSGGNSKCIRDLIANEGIDFCPHSEMPTMEDVKNDRLARSKQRDEHGR